MRLMTLRHHGRFILVSIVLLALAAFASWMWPTLHVSHARRAVSVPSGIRHSSKIYRTFDTQPVKLSVWEKRDDKTTKPAIIMVHGGSWVMGRRDSMPEWNKWLVGLGYTVFDIDYRLAPPATWQAAPSDVKCAIGWIKDRSSHFDIDPKRITLFGSSAGGHLSLLAGYTNNTQIRPSCEVKDTSVAGIISIAGPTDMAAYYAYHNSRRTSEGQKNEQYVRKFMGGTPREYPQRYRDASPITFVHKDVPPTLLLHGAHDQLVPPSQSSTLANTLTRMNAPVLEMSPFGMGHGFETHWNSLGSQAARVSIEEFLRGLR